jgi:outer membrane protein assembly factor BamB
MLSGLVAACGTSETATPTPSPTPPPGSSDWPMYGHDLSRTNYNAAEKSLTVDNVPRLVQRFTAPVGLGSLPSSSGPVVADGRVCVGSSVATGDNYFCFDAATGARIWSRNVGHGPSTTRSVGIGSTAAISDGVLVVGGGDAAYYGLDAGSGSVLWRQPMNTADDAFAWSSPLIANDRAYVGMSASFAADRGELRAYGLHDGTLEANVFFVPLGRRGADIWNSPAMAQDGSRVLVATGNDFDGFNGPLTRAIVGLDPLSLHVVDVHQEAAANQDLDFGTTPIVFHDSTGRGLVGANNKNGVFYAYAVGSLGPGAVWQRPVGISVGAMPAYDPDLGSGGTLFVVGDTGLLFGLDPGTGADRWPPIAIGYANANLAVANGLVFMGSGAGSVTVIDATKGTVLRTLDPPAPGDTFSGVVVANGTVYWMSGPNLNAWSVS